MKIIQKFSSPVFLVLYLFYLIGNHSSSHLRNKIQLQNKLQSKSHLLPSTNINCGPLCLECSLNDIQSCIVCQPGIFEHNNKCYIQCPEGTYPDEEWQVCRNCDSACPLCWGPSSEMCGTKVGVKTTAVLLENEIKTYFLGIKEKNKLFVIDKAISTDNNKDNFGNSANFERNPNSQEMDQKANNNEFGLLSNIDWFNKINVILKDIDMDNLIPRNHKRTIELNNGNDSEGNLISMEDVYGSKKVFSDLPVGSFSRKNGVFIPIPSYLDENMDIVDSHWIYVFGNWLGNKWMNEWVPVLPAFIKKFGDKTKMYFENGGYWLYDRRKDWIWKKIENNFQKNDVATVEEILMELNTIKFDEDSINYLTMKNKLRMKKLELNNSLNKFFDEFFQTNRLIFAKLKDSVNNKENMLINSLDNIKRKISLFYNEEDMINNPSIFNEGIRKLEIDLRKNNSK